MKNIPRKHHYVPQVYLRSFLIQREKGERVYVYDKKKKAIYKSLIKDVAAERDFNTIKNEEDPYYWEKFYDKEVERKYKAIIMKLQSLCIMSGNESVILNDKLKSELAFIICTQLLRTRQAREYQFDIGKQVAVETLTQIKKINKKVLNKDHLKYLNSFELTEEIFKEISLPIINDRDRLIKFMSILMNKKWIICYNIISEINPYITSDHPICFYNLRTKETGFGYNGLAKPDTIIYFPISSKILIALYSEVVYSPFFNSIDRKLYIIDELRFIDFINGLQLKQCHRQAYSSKSNYFEEIQKQTT